MFGIGWGEMLILLVVAIVVILFIVFRLVRTPRKLVLKKMSSAWEYITVELNIVDGTYLDQKKWLNLNDLGQAGWELVCVIPSLAGVTATGSGSPIVPHTMAIFKRQRAGGYNSS